MSGSVNMTAMVDRRRIMPRRLAERRRTAEAPAILSAVSSAMIAPLNRRSQRPHGGLAKRNPPSPAEQSETNQVVIGNTRDRRKPSVTPASAGPRASSAHGTGGLSLANPRMNAGHVRM